MAKRNKIMKKVNFKNAKGVIPASQLQSGRNVFKFTITNNVRLEGEIIHTSNLYKDIRVNSDHVEDHTMPVESGAKIADPLQSLLTGEVIRLDYDGYSTVTVGDYEVPGIVTKPTEVPDQAIKLVYRFSGYVHL